MKEILNPIERIDYKHYVIYNNVKYSRKETLSLRCYALEGEPKRLKDLHTIKWELLYGDGSPVEYFKSNPVPEIEKVFKDTIGKDLIYFEN
jgi:hypothetical protein